MFRKWLNSRGKPVARVTIEILSWVMPVAVGGATAYMAAQLVHWLP